MAEALGLENRSSEPTIPIRDFDRGNRFSARLLAARIHSIRMLSQSLGRNTANVNDGKAGPQALPNEPREVFADSAYRGRTFRGGPSQARLLARRRTGMLGRDEAEASADHRIRCGSRKSSEISKRSYG